MTEPLDPLSLVRTLEAAVRDAERDAERAVARFHALGKMYEGAKALLEADGGTPAGSAAQSVQRVTDARSPEGGGLSRGLTALIPAVETPRRDPNAPKGRQAAFAVLQAGPPAGMTLEQIYDEYARRGWLPDTAEPTNAIRAALQRLRKTGDATFDRRSKLYRLTTGDEPDDEYLAEQAEALEQERQEALAGVAELLEEHEAEEARRRALEDEDAALAAAEAAREREEFP